MKSKHTNFAWLAMATIAAMLLEISFVPPSASAQGAEPPTPEEENTVNDTNQDGIGDDKTILLPEAANTAMLSNQQTGFFSSVTIGMVATDDYFHPRDRLVSLGFSVDLIPPTSGLDTFQQYDIVYLASGWAQAGTGNYQTIESHASDYRTYVYEGGGLFIDQPNPYKQPNERVTPSLLPYPITFRSSYTSADFPPIIVDPDHFITQGLKAD